MTRFIIPAVIGIALLVDGLRAQDGIQRGTIKKLDAPEGTVTTGKDHEFVLSQQTQVAGAQGGNLKERLQRFKEGAEVYFKAGKKDGKDYIVGLKLADARERAVLSRVDTSGFKPLTELGAGEYHGYPGGLYAGGKNQRPAAHEAAGLELAKQVQPLYADGKPSAEGKIVLLSIGMSNTTQEFSAFKRSADSDPAKNPKLVIVDGAQGGMSANRILNPEDNGSGTRFWATVDQRLKAAGVTRAQVHVAWIKQADPGPMQGFPAYARTLQAELRQIVQLLHRRFPNLKLAYLSSRTYGGYARTPLNPEPYAYESGFAVKWLIDEQLRGDPALNYDPARGAIQRHGNRPHNHSKEKSRPQGHKEARHEKNGGQDIKQTQQ